MADKEISRATLKRLPTYLSYLKSMPADSPANISATALAAALHMGEVQVRKDLAMVSHGGRPKIGYRREALIRDIEGFLGYGNTNDAVLVGAGKLGRALLGYSGFAEYGLNIVAAFDASDALIGTTNSGKPILHLSRLHDVCVKHQIRIGIITVPAEHAQKVCDLLIENGILRNYMVDRLNGRKMGMAPTGSARRENYTYAPTSRMRNTFIAPGHDDEDEMIRTMGDGLYAAQMGGGSVNPATGEFNFAVQEGYLVRDGKIVSPVRGASLIGKGEQILMRIDRVGQHMTMGQGMCGSLSGSVPTNVGQPTIRVSSLTVGGK